MTLAFWCVMVLYLGIYLNAQLPAMRAWWLSRKFRKEIKDLENNNDI